MTSEPKSVLDLYYSYKRSTNIALNWLRTGSKNKNTLSQGGFKCTNDIIREAERVRSSRRGVPSYVLSCLRDAIKSRWHVFKLYSVDSDAKNDQDVRNRDKRHKAFINK